MVKKFLILILIGMSFICIGCGDSDDDDNVTNAPVTTSKVEITTPPDKNSIQND